MSKLRKSYRLDKVADDEIKRVAGLSTTGMSEAEVIELWAAQSARRAGVGGGVETEPEKKSGESGEVFHKITNEMIGYLDREIKKKSSQIKAKMAEIALKKNPLLGVVLPGQATNLAMRRANCAPMKRPGEK